MIKKLQKKLILFCGLATMLFMSIIFAILFTATSIQLNNTMDSIISSLLINKGMPQPGFDMNEKEDFFTKEAEQGFRYFIVKLDKDDNIILIDTNKVSTINSDDAKEYALEVLDENNKGWYKDFRYRIEENDFDTTIVFVDGSMNKKLTARTNLAVLFTIGGVGLVIFAILVALSKKLVSPIAESYEKQKQFITDINHEIKTPLTLIKTNIDIVESEVGNNEWLDDIKKETETMTDLVNELVTLTKMDEKRTNINNEEINMSLVLTETFNEFKSIADSKNKEMVSNIEDNVNYLGDKNLILRLVGILLDNAIKYCDEDGVITMNVYRKKYVYIQVENTYKNIDELKINRLFDRFYRDDKSRTTKGSFGIGLSIAKSICENINADIKCNAKNHNAIVFTITLK